MNHPAKSLFALALLLTTSCSESGASPANQSKQAASAVSDVQPEEAATEPDYKPNMEIRGLQIYMDRYHVSSTVSERGMFVSPTETRPMMEMYFNLPQHKAADTVYIDTPECRDELTRRSTMTENEANSLAALTLNDCTLAARLFYDAEDVVIAFYLTPPAFGLERVTIQEFAQAVVDNAGVHELHSEVATITTLTQNGTCYNYLGLGDVGEKLNASNCGFMRLQVEEPITANASFD